MRGAVFAAFGLACLVGPTSVRAGYLIDDFSQGVSFDTVYSETLVDVQIGLDAQHALGGQRLLTFHAVSPTSGSARGALDTAQGRLTLDSIQGGDLGGGGLEVQYGEFSQGTDIGFDLAAFANQQIEVRLQFLAAGDSKGPQPGITWRTNIHSRDLVEVAPGIFEIVDHFTNVDVPIANTAVPFTASLPVSSLFGGLANPADLVGMKFSFLPIGTGGAVVISRIEIVPEPSTFWLAIASLVCLAIFRTRRPFGWLS